MVHRNKVFIVSGDGLFTMNEEPDLYGVLDLRNFRYQEDIYLHHVFSRSEDPKNRPFCVNEVPAVETGHYSSSYQNNHCNGFISLRPSYLQYAITDPVVVKLLLFFCAKNKNKKFFRVINY